MADKFERHRQPRRQDEIQKLNLEAEGYRVSRFWNSDVLGNPDGVHSAIAEALVGRHPHPASPIQGEG